MKDFFGRERVEAKPILTLDPTEQVFVPLERKIGVETALKEDLHPSGIFHLLELFPEDLPREYVPLWMTHGTIESAEAAARRADVRVIDVPVDNVRYDTVRVLFRSGGICCEPELEEAALEQEPFTVGRGESLA